MYTLDDLDKPTRLMAANLENLENGKECFHVAVTKAVQQLDKISVILRDIQNHLTGKNAEIVKLINKTSIIEELSIKFDKLIDAKEAKLMNITPQIPPSNLLN
jgi:hypothetical protein